MSSPSRLCKAIDNAVERAQKAYDQKNYEEAIKMTPVGVTIPIPVPKTVAPLYYIRAMSKAKVAKFEKAEADAYSIVRLDGKSTLGYFCLANIYAMQGKQYRVIDVCHQASKVLRRRKDSMAEAQLSSLQKDAEKRLQKRIDFVCCLSQELLVLILQTFSTEQLAELTLISLSWHARITSCAPLWRYMELDTDYKAAWLVIPSVGAHARDILYLKSSQRIRRLKDQGTTTSDFCKQASLYRKKVEQDYHGIIDSKYVKHHFNFPLHLDTVLTAFPNVKHLKLVGGHPKAHCDGLSIAPQHLHLTTLNLSIMTIVQNEYLEVIMRRCPSICRLFISNCSWNILSVFEQFSTLEVLVVHLNRPVSLYRRLMKATCADNHPLKGLRSLVLEAASQNHERYRMQFTCYDISRLVERNCDTLEELIITHTQQHNQQLYSEMKKTIRWDRILSFQYPNLRRLCCVIPDSREDEFCMMLRQCTVLVDCSIIHPKIMPEVVLNALSTKKGLRRLALTFGDVAPDVNDIAVRELLLQERLGIFGISRSTPGLSLNGLKKLLKCSSEGINGLQHICFNDCSWILSSILDLLATSTIRGIEFKSNTFFYQDIRNFVVKLDHLSTLEWVIFNSNLCIDENGDEWMLGNYYEFHDLRLRQLFQAPTMLSEDRLNTLLRKERYTELECDLMDAASGRVDLTPSDVMSSFLESKLDL